MRPSVENNAAGGAFSFANVASTRAFTSCLTRSVGDEQSCQRPDLHRLVLIPRSLQPGILLIHFEEFVGRFGSRIFRIGLSVERVFSSLISSGILVPGMGHIFCDIRRIDRVNLRQIAIQDDAPGKKEVRRIFDGPLRITAIRHEIPKALTALEPIAIEPCHRENVGNVHLIHKRNAPTWPPPARNRFVRD